MPKKAAKQTPKSGAIVAIPLPGGKFAFARLFKNYDLGVCDLVSGKIEAIIAGSGRTKILLAVVAVKNFF